MSEIFTRTEESWLGKTGLKDAVGWEYQPRVARSWMARMAAM